MTSFREELETFENQHPQRDYVITIRCPEFTSVCPKTGQPDFGQLTIRYTPSARCVELKSLKMYLQRFRNEGIFYENVTNQILDDLVAVLSPRMLELEAAFTPRGGHFHNRHGGASPTGELVSDATRPPPQRAIPEHDSPHTFKQIFHVSIAQRDPFRIRR